MACQFLLLYLLKTRGKVPHPTFKEAIDSFEFAQSPEEVNQKVSEEKLKK